MVRHGFIEYSWISIEIHEMERKAWIALSLICWLGAILFFKIWYQKHEWVILVEAISLTILSTLFTVFWVKTHFRCKHLHQEFVIREIMES
jgi:hypothetical protein